MFNQEQLHSVLSLTHYIFHLTICIWAAIQILYRKVKSSNMKIKDKMSVTTNMNFNHVMSEIILSFSYGGINISHKKHKNLNPISHCSEV